MPKKKSSSAHHKKDKKKGKRKHPSSEVREVKRILFETPQPTELPPIIIPGKKTRFSFKKFLGNHRKFLFFALFLVGLNMTFLGYVFQQYQSTILSFQVAPVTKVELNHRRGEPNQIQIESQQINLAVVPAAIKNGIWETSDKDVTHLDTSARPGEKGNVVLYGHNRKHIFMNLKKIKMNDVIKVKTSEGKEYEYTVTSIDVVKPDYIQAVLPTDYEVLTVYTCTGFLDSMRLVIKASPTLVRSL